MILTRKLLFILALATLTACSALPAKTPETPLQPAIPKTGETEAPDPPLTSTKQSPLAESVLAAEWKGSPWSHWLFPVDPDSGQAIAGYEPIELGQAISHAFSPDQTTLAVVGFVSSEHPNGGSLHLIDLKTWKEHVQELRLDSYVNAIAFSPNGDRLAIAYGNWTSRLLIFDVSKPLVKSETAVQEASMDFLVYKLKFSVDGSGLLVYGTQGENQSTIDEMLPRPPIVALLDSADLSVRWNAELAGIRHGFFPKDENVTTTTDLHQPGAAIYFFPGLVYEPNGDILYIVHPDEDKLTTVDFEGQKVSAVEIQSELSWFERLLSLGAGVAHAKVAEGTAKYTTISPDGQFLYIVGQRNELFESKNDGWQVNSIPLGLQIVRAKDGRRLAHHDTEAQELSISADGKYLYLRGWGEMQDSAWTEIIDTATSESIAHLESMWLIPTRRINGEPILASSVWIEPQKEHHNAFVEQQSVLAKWTSPNYLGWLTTP